MKNTDIRNYANKRKICLWQISEKLGYSHESAFSRVMRHELSEEKKLEVMRVIDELVAEQ